MNLLDVFCEKNTETLSPATLCGYKYDIEGYIRFLSAREGIEVDGEHVDRSILLANEADVYAYVNYARTVSKNSVNTLNRKISAIKCFYEFLYENRYLKKNIAVSVSSLQTYDADNKKILSVDDCRKLLENVSGRNKLRDTALIMMFLFCGLSVGEVCALQKTDLEGETVAVRKNGDIKKIIPKNEALKSILSDFLSCERISTSDNVFEASTGKPLSRRSVQQIIVKHLAHAGFYEPGDATEMLRRSGASMLIEHANVTIGELQYYLGHKNIATTSAYAKSALKKVGKDQINQIPLANYRKKV